MNAMLKPETQASEGRADAGHDAGDASGRWQGVLRRGWRLLPFAGILYALVGLPFLLTGEPTGGPYREGERYPFGTELQAWQVTVGVDWLAFALLFAVAAAVARQLPSRSLRVALIVSGALIWLPHLVIGLAFAIDR